MMIRLLAADGNELWVPDDDIVPMSYVIYVKGGAPVAMDTWVLDAKKPPPTEADGGE